MNRLHFSEIATERDLRLAIVECGYLCYDRGLITSNDGNISTRLGEDRVIITPAGLCKGRMDVDDLLILDLDGKMVKAHPRRHHRPSTETAMHLEAYRQRPDVRAAIHAHPVFATALTVAGMPLPIDVLPEVLLTLGEVPTSTYATPSTDEDAGAVSGLLGQHDAILLRQHGALTVGADLDEALVNLERVEHVAEVFWRAQMLGKVNRIPKRELLRLSELRMKYKREI
jgi:L-fuculose-phosphate aldolase